MSTTKWQGKGKTGQEHISRFPVLTLCIPMGFPIKFDTAKSGWSIVYIEGSQVIISKKYSRTSVARTLMARSPCLDRTLFLVPRGYFIWKVTLDGQNYPWLELIFMVPSLFEPMKFYCIYLSFLSLKIIFVFPKSGDPDEMPLYAAFHLGLHCLSRYQFRGFCNFLVHKGFKEEHSGSVVECLTQDRGVAGSSLTGGTELCCPQPISTGSPHEDSF